MKRTKAQGPRPDAPTCESADALPSTTAPTEAPAEAETTPATPKGKVALLVELLRRPEGATVPAMMAATGWQAHSVRGAIAGAIKKKLRHAVTSERMESGRLYRIQEEAKS